MDTSHASSTWRLVEDIQNGHEVDTAWATLWSTYQPMILKYMRTHLKGDPQQAEDLTSEVFTRAIARIHTVTWQNRDIGAWLATIARNLVTDHYKRAYTQRVMLDPDMAARAGTAAALVDQRSGPAEQAVAAQQQQALQRLVGQLLAGLPPRQREVLCLRFWQELSVSDTGRLMGMSPGSVKTLQWRAMGVLRDRLRVP